MGGVDVSVSISSAWRFEVVGQVTLRMGNFLEDDANPPQTLNEYEPPAPT